MYIGDRAQTESSFKYFNSVQEKTTKLQKEMLKMKQKN
jgi:hypothetical protein